MTGTNVMVRAQVFDESGQSWSHEIWVHITNWDSSGGFSNSAGFLIGMGQPSLDRHVSELEMMDDVQKPTCLILGSLRWEYEQGYCVSAGFNGMYTRSGAHSGLAQLFIGIASKNRQFFAGFAFGVYVE
jgi:hypothetical protein